MDKIKILSGIIVAMSIIIGYISYATQTVYYFYLSAVLIIVYFIITFLIWTRGKNGNFFRVVKGDFGLKEDIEVHGNLYNKKFPGFLKEPNNYSILGV